jgi:type IV pilus assembly protein PilC
MPTFSYIALDRSGAEQTGTIEAGSQRDAAFELRRRSMRVLRLHEGALPLGPWQWLLNRLAGLLPSRLLRRLPVRASDRVFFFYQLALMVASGGTVVEALRASGPLCSRLALERGAMRMADRITSGSSLSDAMRQEKKLFPNLAASLVAAGEQSGDLAQVLERLAANLERTQDIKRDLFSATIYPTIVLISALTITWVLLHFVIPAYARFFSGRRIAMPYLLGRFISLSDWLDLYGLYLFGGIGLTVFLVLAAYTTQRGKRVIDWVLLRVPLIGYALRTTAMAQFSHTLSMLLGSGLTVLEGLEVVASATPNAVIAGSFRRAREQIIRGGSLTKSLQQSNIPPLIWQMLAVGERSGELGSVLAQMGRFYDRQLSTRVKLIITWIEPIMILVVGGLVGLIYFAIYQAILRAATGGMGNF